MNGKCKRYCSVPNCNNYKNESISMHYFPSNPKILKQWIRCLGILKKITKYMNVCSTHFKDTDFFTILPTPTITNRRRLKRIAIPSKNLPNSSISRLRPVRKRTEKKTTNCNIASPTTVGTIIKMEDNDLPIKLSQSPATPPPEKQYADHGCQVNLFTKEIQLSLVDSLFECDTKLYTFTGVNMKTFENMFKCMEKAVSVWRLSEQFLREKILIVLIKLKTNMSFRQIAILFNISFTTAQNYFHDLIHVLSETFKTLIYLPSKEQHLNNIPKCFEKYRKVRMVLDCTEVHIEKFTCLKCRIRSYSNYKKGYTVKFLVGVTPPGTICFVSSGYGGRISYKAIVNRENCLDLLEYYSDSVMVDKGVLIEKECLDRGITLVRPPYLRDKKQLSKEDALKTAQIARARVHVERTIQRIKIFKIFHGTLSLSLLPYIDDIINLVCVLVNLSQPVLADSKF